MFSIALTASALDDLKWFRKAEQKLILDGMRTALSFQPDVESRNRKRLRPNQVSEWEARLRRYRVFYDVDAASGVVEVKMIGRKEGNVLFVRGEEYRL